MQVHYMPLGGDELQEVAINASHSFFNLKRNAKYSFYVRAYVRKSASDPSDKLVYDPSLPAAPVATPPPSYSSPSSGSTAGVQPRPPPRTLSPPGPSPSPPGPNVALLAVSPTQLKVSWRKFPGFGGGPVALYKIQYRRHKAKEFDIEVVKGALLLFVIRRRLISLKLTRLFFFLVRFLIGDVYEYTITGLHPGRKYDVRVVPGSMNAAGPWFTKEMPRVMGPSSPQHHLSGPPTVELVAHDFNGTSSVLVSWDDVGPLNGRPGVDDVRLRYRQQGSTEAGPVLVLPPTGSQWISQLRAATVYEFELSGNVDGQEGPVSQATIRTLPDPDLTDDDSLDDDDNFDPGKPLETEALVLSSDALKISWHFQPTSGSIIFYTVRFVSVPEEPLPGFGPPLPPVVRYLRTTANHARLSNLTAYTLYRISIKCHDRDGRSSLFSWPPTEARTLTDLPARPQSPSWQMLADGSVQISWRPPVHPNGIITEYAVLVSADPQADVGKWTRHLETGTRLRTQLTDLTPATPIYYYRVQARTSAGWGAMTEPRAGSMTSQPPNESLVPPLYSGEPPETSTTSEQYLGVIIGLTIGLGFALVSAFIMLWRSRCIKRLSPERVAASRMGSNGNGGDRSAVAGMNGMVVCNGNGGLHHPATKPPNGMRHYGRPSSGREHQLSSLVEMEAFVPMLSTIPDDVPVHLDTKVYRVLSRTH